MSFDPGTVSLMKICLEDAWGSLSPAVQHNTTKSALAVRILETAARGERDPARLRASALLHLSAFDH
jgi:hypothetical protein